MSLLSKVTIQHSTAYDLISSLIRIKNNKLFTPSKSPNQEVVEWADQVLAGFPDEMRRLLTVFYSKDSAYAMTLGGYVAKSGAPDARALLEYLETVPAQDILLRFLYYGIGPGSEVSLADVARLVENEKEAVHFINDQLSFQAQEKWQMLQFVMDPEGMKRDLMRLMSWYYGNHYAKVEREVRAFLKGPEQALRDRLDKYGEEYLRLLLPVDYSKRENSKITCAVSLYWETGQFINILDDVYIFGYRYFEKVEGQHPILAGIQVFKVLADETRLHIIRLLAQRPWYGHELAQRLSISNSTISHHMTQLIYQGLARSYREENRVYFELVEGEFKRVINSTLDNILEEA